MNDTLFAEAVLGKDAEEFIASDLGRYLIGQADMEIEEAQEALCKVAPWRTRRIRDLQNQIWRAQSFKGWLLEMVTAGKAAVQVLEEHS